LGGASFNDGVVGKVAATAICAGFEINDRYSNVVVRVVCEKMSHKCPFESYLLRDIAK
jgi:hypothetical protein